MQKVDDGMVSKGGARSDQHESARARFMVTLALNGVMQGRDQDEVFGAEADYVPSLRKRFATH